MKRLDALREWWSTAESDLITHRRLKWIWISLIPLSYVWRENIIWLVFMSHYAILVGHWGGETSAKTEVKQEQAEEAQDRGGETRSRETGSSGSP